MVERRGKHPTTGSFLSIGTDDLSHLNHPVCPKSRPPLCFVKLVWNASSVHRSTSTVISPAAVAYWQKPHGIFGKGHASSLFHVFVRCEWSLARFWNAAGGEEWMECGSTLEGEEGLKNGPEEGKS
ncbi:hypothetical protein BT69DRAFT_1277898 [Atractiella rhizophila]|nr:hypothetical protein BT69DRAFT_1277898 [Atractiella rhizophila]